jgi:hypothetical protein
MQATDEEMETIHLYVVRQGEKRPFTAFPLLCALVCLLGIVAITLYSAQNPYYEHERLTVPATFLPTKVFKAEAQIIPTGLETYPALFAHGTLTLSNGSVISQELPKNFIIPANNGIEVTTDSAVYVPAGNADGFGMSTVSAHLLTSGINMSTLSINQVIGTSLYVRNLTPFTGGRAAYTVKVVTPQDIQTATNAARSLVASQKADIQAFLVEPCKEAAFASQTLIRLSWGCQFATYKVPSYMHVLGATLNGRNFLVTVEFIPQPQKIWAK